MCNYSTTNRTLISKKGPEGILIQAPLRASYTSGEKYTYPGFSPNDISIVQRDKSVRNISTNLLRRLFGEYKFAFISNQLQKDERDMQNR
ncbi:hypothetical protein TNCV_510781 [Trichonephila clavipes]|nr:hypothetical protein TNCV_510781 [Trichonephila clavipes]